MATYGTLLTNVGERLIAQYLQAGGKLDITELAVGDGGGAEYKPTQDMTALRGEKWRGSIDAITISESSPNVIVIEAMVPADVGGFTIREAGVIDARGNLIGIMNTPQTEKVASGEGATTEQYIEMYLAVSSTSVFDLTVDPSLAASKEELRQHNEDAYAHLGMLAKIDGKADAADVPTLVELDGKLEEHNKDAQAHGDIRAALAGKADGTALTAHNAADDAHQDIRTALTEKANQSDLETVRSAASTAQTTANEAKTAAYSAQSTADSAASAASTAQTTANTANTTANNALPKNAGAMTTNPAVGTQGVRNIYAGTGNPPASLTTGALYAKYE